MSKKLIITAQAIVPAPIYFNSNTDIDTLESILELVKKLQENEPNGWMYEKLYFLLNMAHFANAKCEKWYNWDEVPYGVNVRLSFHNSENLQLFENYISNTPIKIL